jgi:hypothetical protein
MQGVRAAARFGYLGLFAIAVLAGFGVAAWRERLTGSLKLTMSALIVGAAVLEPLAAPIRYEPFNGIPPIYATIRHVPDAVVAELPFPSPRSFFRNAPYILNSTAHWKPLLNGYTGFVPASYQRHAVALSTFPSAESVRALQDWGVTHVFVHLDRLDRAASESLSHLHGLRQIAADGTVALYLVARDAERP